MALLAFFTAFPNPTFCPIRSFPAGWQCVTCLRSRHSSLSPKLISPVGRNSSSPPHLVLHRNTPPSVHQAPLSFSVHPPDSSAHNTPPFPSFPRPPSTIGSFSGSSLLEDSWRHFKWSPSFPFHSDTPIVFPETPWSLKFYPGPYWHHDVSSERSPAAFHGGYLSFCEFLYLLDVRLSAGKGFHAR